MGKFIFITSGVVSGLGKGIIASSIGAILKSSGLNVNMMKMDPYLNIDPGTMNPKEHGEVYVTYDGGETDLDFGHYERFIDNKLSKNSSISAGKIYSEVLEKERRGEYKGKTVQIIPHVTNLIKEKIYYSSKQSNADVTIVEIGGTVGDIESQSFLETIRQIKFENKPEDTIFVHLGLLPWLNATKEFKTKPIQHSIKALLGFGIIPNVIIVRSEKDVLDDIKQKIAMFCNVKNENIIIAKDEKSIYKIPLILKEQNFCNILKNELKINVDNIDLKNWEQINQNILESKEEIEIKIVGKYIECQDAYLSIVESLKICGSWNKVNIKIDWINAKKLTNKNIVENLKNAQAIIVPGGFGESGFNGKLLACKYVRENNIPFLGICYGMQIATIEFARNVLKLDGANTTEIDPNTKYPIIDIISDHNTDTIGGTLRLGAYKSKIKKNTLAYKLYNSDSVSEKHRHRYEFNNKFKEQFEKNGMVFSGVYEEKKLCEIIEIPKNDFFIAVQYHPELTSTVNKPNPLFMGLVKKVIENNRKNS